MIGAVEPLEQLESVESRSAIISRIMDEYPVTQLGRGPTLYRLRSDALDPADLGEYDSPPRDKLGSNRLDSTDLPVLYASPYLETCVHECRVSAEDDVFFATLAPTRELKLLDLSRILVEKGVTEFESLDMAVHMLFLAGSYSYGITRALARIACERGYDGIVYPSYFSLLQTGAIPFETGYGLSLRRIRGFVEREEAKTVPNVGLFGYPIRDGLLEVACINRLILRRVQYEFHFGPIIDAALEPWTTDVGEESE
ncbi:RES family NAD+ phosphorylase [Candidatus Poribacteria bacterium]|nr:RES family NAD+ phosphorylase [Candidatus Poribacteria bacterium]